MAVRLDWADRAICTQAPRLISDVGARCPEGQLVANIAKPGVGIEPVADAACLVQSIFGQVYLG